jgi:hypothetical protein
MVRLQVQNNQTLPVKYTVFVTKKGATTRDDVDLIVAKRVSQIWTIVFETPKPDEFVTVMSYGPGGYGNAVEFGSPVPSGNRSWHFWRVQFAPAGVIVLGTTIIVVGLVIAIGTAGAGAAGATAAGGGLFGAIASGLAVVLTALGISLKGLGALGDAQTAIQLAEKLE